MKISIPKISMPNITYNAPVVLTYTLIAFLVFLIDAYLLTDFSKKYFSVASFSFYNPMDYFRMISHTMGHSGWGHFFGNIMFIAALGPILESKYGSWTMLEMFSITAVLSALYTVCLSSTGMYGGSGIVFALIVAASITNSKEGNGIPLTFILIIMIYLLKEVGGLFVDDGISHAGHLIGGGVGAIYGFALLKENDEEIKEVYKGEMNGVKSVGQIPHNKE
jgi:membrane associated rhomboid family serine protease